ncbi:CPBP family intramembrane glutamic endopeptidase [Dongia sedimenti]|uniref:CPBP family intramembrane glutamic endopeptidase n=1 Tax=Dongia sedimenti TaxID=3064282 RepID=A0ABU0YLC1_9PROT|nr:CPBP family intramembrane glutamic endopeptidase [Rhodospirillaceae bacterium R-7]
MASAGNGQQFAASRAIIGWMIAATGAEVMSQLIRLQQTEPPAWLFCDYAGRLAALALLAANPAVRGVVYRAEPLKISLAIVINWGLLLIPICGAAIVAGHVYAAYLPTFRLGTYPRPDGWLLIFDLTFGLALVALHEEIVLRRAMRLALGGLGDGRAMTAVSSLLFGGYHWWTGVPNMIFAGVFGVFAMLLFRRTGALWPVVVLHFMVDLICFI